MRYPKLAEIGDGYAHGWNDAIEETRRLNEREEAYRDTEIQHLRERNADLAREVQRLLAHHEALLRAMADIQALAPLPPIVMPAAEFKERKFIPGTWIDIPEKDAPKERK